jgi:hypothetical protein
MAATITGLATAGAVLAVRELSSQAFSVTLGQLTKLLATIGSRPDDVSKQIHNEMLQLIPHSKLKIIGCVLMDFEQVRDESKTIDALCERLIDLEQQIHYWAKEIETKIDKYEQLYFRTWRTLDVSAELAAIRQQSHHIDETFELFKWMLSAYIKVRSSVSLPSLTTSARPRSNLLSIQPPKPIDILTLANP